jgi:hypothetical protein
VYIYLKDTVAYSSSHDAPVYVAVSPMPQWLSTAFAALNYLRSLSSVVSVAVVVVVVY